MADTREQMTDTTMQLLSQGTDPVKMPDFDILAEGKTLSGVAERLMSLSLTDNRGFEADQLTITLDDADGQLQLPPRGARLTVLIGWKGAVAGEWRRGEITRVVGDDCCLII